MLPNFNPLWLQFQDADVTATDDAFILSYWTTEWLETDIILHTDEFIDQTINDLFLLTPQFSFFIEFVYIQIYYCQLDELKI